MNRINRYSIHALVKSARLNGVEELMRGSLNYQMDLTVDEAIRLGHSVEMNQAAKKKVGSSGPYVSHPGAVPVNGALLVECWCGKDRLPIATHLIGEAGVSCGRQGCQEGSTPVSEDNQGRPTQCAVCGNALQHPPRGRWLKYCGTSCRNKEQYKRELKAGKRRAKPPKPKQPTLDERIEQLQREIADLVHEQWSSA